MANKVRSDEELAAVRVGGSELHNSTIYLAPYDQEWPRLFAREEMRIRGVLGPGALLVEHVGSTSVPGLSAKPRIDIALAVADTTDEEAYVPALEAAGYVLRIREPDWHEHRVFKGPDTDVNLHVFTVGCSEISRMTAFRDHLNDDVADRQLYEQTKQRLASQTWKYVQHYADAKSDVVEEIITRSGVTPRDCARY